MPTEIIFSIMSDNGSVIQPFLDAFEAETGIRVMLQVMRWDMAWNQLVRSAIYNEGADISEIGNTWTRDLVGMNVLRPFSSGEITSMGRPEAFIPAAWANVLLGAERAWAIPWTAASRLIYYRPGLLLQAGIDPGAAFATPASVLETVRRLQENGLAEPVAIPTGETNGTLQNIASWIWAEGGDFIRPDGRAMAILEPDALRGMRAYFQLGRFLPKTPLLGAVAADDWFRQHQDTALTINGTWLLNHLGEEYSPQGGQYAVCPLPGPSFIGGSNLVIWKFSRRAGAAYQFARYLTQTAVQLRLNGALGVLPARVDALEMPPYSSEPYWKIAVQALQSGRSFPLANMWGVIEDRLVVGFDSVWKEVLAQPDADPQDALVRILTPVCQRSSTMLQETIP